VPEKDNKPNGEKRQPNGEFSDWFEQFTDTDAGPWVLCFPFSGSGASMFARWKQELGSITRLCAVRLPGRESKLQAAAREQLLPLADELATAVKREREQRGSGGERPGRVPASPLVLVGFSLGALLAFEVARALRRRDLEIDLLVAGSSAAPHSVRSRGKLHQLPDDRFLTRIDRLYGAVPQAVWDNPELKQLVLPALRADIKMFETYRYQDEAPLSCEILTLRGSEDRAVLPKHVYPWREQGRSFRHRTFPGDHYFVRTQSQSVLNMLKRRLQRLSGDPR
jgi:medium-chain acyl-[acyl-carrier-protein] hydrolase